MGGLGDRNPTPIKEIIQEVGVTSHFCTQNSHPSSGTQTKEGGHYFRNIIPKAHAHNYVHVAVQLWN